MLIATVLLASLLIPSSVNALSFTDARQAAIEVVIDSAVKNAETWLSGSI